MSTFLEYLNVHNEPFTDAERTEMLGRIQGMVNDIEKWVMQKSAQQRNGNRWFEIEGVLKVYIRHATRPLDRKVLERMIDIGSVEVEQPYMHRGCFTMFLRCLQDVANRMSLPIYVENVMLTWFTEFLKRKDFVEVPTADENCVSPCLFKRPMGGKDIAKY